MDGRLLRVPQEPTGSTDLRGRIVKKIDTNGGEKCKTHASTQRQIARQSSFHTMIHVSVIEFQGRGFCADTTGQLEPYQAARICYRITSVHLGSWASSFFPMEISWEHGISLATSKLRICKGIRDDPKRDYDKRIG